MEKDENQKLLFEELGENLENGKFDYQIIQDDGSIKLDTMEYGLISCFATWSGYTYEIGNSILSQIAEGTNFKIPLKLLDCDFITIENQKKIFNSYNWGYFESCWVEKGEIQKRYKYKHELKPFIDYVKIRLLVREK